MKGHATTDRFVFERALLRQGMTLIAGVDEVDAARSPDPSSRRRRCFRCSG